MKVTITFIFVLIFGNCFSQQDPNPIMYFNSHTYINPAYLGILNTSTFTANGNLQNQISHKIYSLDLSFDIQIDKINSGVGIRYYNNTEGLLDSKRLILSYAYQFKLKKDKIISAGISSTYYNNVFDFSDVYSLDDPIIIPNKVSEDYFNFNIGVIYVSGNFNLGTSFTQILNRERIFSTVKQRLYIHSAYIFNWRKFEIKPSTIVKFYDKDFTIDIGIIALYRDLCWVGYVYNTSKYYNRYMIGFDINNLFRIGYGRSIGSKSNPYDVPHNELIIVFVF